MMIGEVSANKKKRRHARQRLIFTPRGIAAHTATACAVAGFLAAAPALPVWADPAPREALPSSEAIGWLLETEATGSAAPWINSRSGYSGTVTITQTWHQADGTPCRTFTIAAVAGGSPTVLKGRGCRGGLGEWNLNEDAPTVMAAGRPSPPAKKPAAPDAMPAADPAIAAVLPTAAPDAMPIADPVLADPVPADDDAAGAVDPTLSHSPAATAEPKPLSIAASLPSRSDE